MTSLIITKCIYCTAISLVGFDTPRIAHALDSLSNTKSHTRVRYECISSLGACSPAVTAPLLAL
jgi:hypothetical protein